MNKPQYFIGIGAQKAGTTWLHDLLDSYSECAVPPVKELHFFDIKYVALEPGAVRSSELSSRGIYRDRLVAMANMAQGFERAVKAAISAGDGNPSRAAAQRRDIYQDGYLAKINVDARLKNIERLARYLRIRNSETYLEYLHEVCQRKRAKVVGEFTPAYSMLPAEAFREIDGLMPGCKFIFIMRDPVDRFLSQIRFKKKRSENKGKDFDPIAYFDEAIASPAFLVRSDYRRTIETVESVVGPDRVMYIFFEEMVGANTLVKTIRGVEQFLGLSPMDESLLAARVEVKKNASATADFTEEHKARARKALAGAYEYVEERFGYLPAGWMAG